MRTKPRNPRPVHYVAHGGGGLSFECYRRAIRRMPPWPHSAQGPKRTTDLNRVTCELCWREVAKLVELDLGNRLEREDVRRDDNGEAEDEAGEE